MTLSRSVVKILTNVTDCLLVGTEWAEQQARTNGPEFVLE
jgi:hypothetical protein